VLGRPHAGGVDGRRRGEGASGRLLSRFASGIVGQRRMVEGWGVVGQIH
jgi:hypothetical protein